MDSTPELRARRDRMLAMIDEYEESRRHPYLHAADANGIVRIRERINTFTAQWMPLEPMTEIHHDDLDWLLRLWEESDGLDYELWRAGAS